MNRKTKPPSPRSTAKRKTIAKRQTTAQRATTFSCVAPDASTVFVAGTFNGWKPDELPLDRDEDGRWGMVLDLPPGRHEFKFIIDGQWCCEPGCEDDYRGCPNCVPNEHGTTNRVLEVD